MPVYKDSTGRLTNLPGPDDPNSPEKQAAKLQQGIDAQTVTDPGGGWEGMSILEDAKKTAELHGFLDRAAAPYEPSQTQAPFEQQPGQFNLDTTQMVHPGLNTSPREAQIEEAGRTLGKATHGLLTSPWDTLKGMIGTPKGALDTVSQIPEAVKALFDPATYHGAIPAMKEGASYAANHPEEMGSQLGQIAIGEGLGAYGGDIAGAAAEAAPKAIGATLRGVGKAAEWAGNNPLARGVERMAPYEVIAGHVPAGAASAVVPGGLRAVGRGLQTAGDWAQGATEAGLNGLKTALHTPIENPFAEEPGPPNSVLSGLTLSPEAIQRNVEATNLRDETGYSSRMAGKLADIPGAGMHDVTDVPMGQYAIPGVEQPLDVEDVLANMHANQPEGVPHNRVVPPDMWSTAEEMARQEPPFKQPTNAFGVRTNPGSVPSDIAPGTNTAAVERIAQLRRMGGRFPAEAAGELPGPPKLGMRAPVQAEAPAQPIKAQPRPLEQPPAIPADFTHEGSANYNPDQPPPGPAIGTMLAGRQPPGPALTSVPDAAVAKLGKLSAKNAVKPNPRDMKSGDLVSQMKSTLAAVQKRGKR